MKFSILRFSQNHYRLVVVGGGTAGCAVASKFSRILPKNQIAVVEPHNTHYYQPGFTMAAAGLMDFDSLRREESSVLPRSVNWLRSSVQRFNPSSNALILQDEQHLTYDFLVLATGLELRYDFINGLPLGTESVLQSPSVCSIYFPEGALKTKEELRKFPSDGTAIFSFPSTHIKCPGAPQKICYLSEEIFRDRGIRSDSKVLYCTALGRIFGVPKYAAALEKIVEQRGIELHTRHNLIAVLTDKRQAVFEVLDGNSKSTGIQKTFEYSLLHIGPPCSPVKAFREHAEQQQQKNNENTPQLTDDKGWVKVHPLTLQSPSFANVFAIGDCANTPNSKTAAAISSQLKTLSKNLQNVMAKEKPSAKYDGYASCPLVVDHRHVILAEFSPLGPLETFPYDQSRPTLFAYLMKRYLMPPLYWMFLLKGHWEGPAKFRKIFGIFSRKSNENNILK